MQATELETVLKQRRLKLERALGELDSNIKRAKDAKARLDEATAMQEACTEAARLMGSFADERQEQTLHAVEKIASAGLSVVFGEDVELKLVPKVRARRPEIDVVIKTGELETSVLDARGGGLAQVAGLLLKITTLLLTNGARKLIVADEPLAMLSAEYAPRIADFLSELCEKTGLQLIMVTHDEVLSEAADTVVRLKSIGGQTVAEKVS